MSNPFKNDQNQYYLRALFLELSGPTERKFVLYTLKDEDCEGYPSLFQKYMEVYDPTEFRFAEKYFANLDHWRQITECEWFKPFITRWRKELETRLKSEALARIMLEARAGKKESFQANKYLLEKAWEPKEASGNGRGRPSKADIQRAASDAVNRSERISNDFDRLILPKQSIQISRTR